MTDHDNLEHEEWRLIPGFGGRYQASSWGRIRHSKHRRILRFYVTSDGYCLFGFRCPIKEATRSFRVNRAVALAFLPNSENKPQINHKDTDKLNNRPGNLEWATSKENMEHSAKEGLTSRGVDRHNAVLSDQLVREIRASYDAGERVCDIGRRHGVKYYAAWFAARRTFWKHVE